MPADASAAAFTFSKETIIIGSSFLWHANCYGLFNLSSVVFYSKPTGHKSPYTFRFPLLTFPSHHPCTNLTLPCTCVSQNEKYTLLSILNQIHFSTSAAIPFVFAPEPSIPVGAFCCDLLSSLWSHRPQDIQKTFLAFDFWIESFIYLTELTLTAAVLNSDGRTSFLFRGSSERLLFRLRGYKTSRLCGVCYRSSWSFAFLKATFVNIF